MAGWWQPATAALVKAYHCRCDCRSAANHAGKHQPHTGLLPPVIPHLLLPAQQSLDCSGGPATVCSPLLCPCGYPAAAGLRTLQGRKQLQDLLTFVKSTRDNLDWGPGGPPPLLVKIAPDLTDADKADIAAVVLATRVDGLVVSNTTISRPGEPKATVRWQPAPVYRYQRCLNCDGASAAAMLWQHRLHPAALGVTTGPFARTHCICICTSPHHM